MRWPSRGSAAGCPSSGPLNGVLFSGTDALDHVQIVAGTDGPGVWLPDYVARSAGVRVPAIRSSFDPAGPSSR